MNKKYKCNKCDEEKNLNDLVKCKNCKSGVRPLCKECHVKQVLLNRRKNKDYYNAYMRTYLRVRKNEMS